MGNECFITKIEVSELRLLKNLTIDLSENTRKNLILTGKNGSGKTTLLKSICTYLTAIEEGNANALNKYNFSKVKIGGNVFINGEDLLSKVTPQEKLQMYCNDVIKIKINNINEVDNLYSMGKFVLCYLGALRNSSIDKAYHIENVQLNSTYGISQSSSNDIMRYMVHLKTQQAYARNENDNETVKLIEAWFERFQTALRKLLCNDNLQIKYDYKKYSFQFIEEGKPPYTFNELSDGYSSVINIFAEIMMRMEQNWLLNGNTINTYDISGIVLIDEIETHLHIAMQKSILPVLTELFPNIQFIVSTHSPYILNSVDNAVIYDLEKNTRYDDFSSYSISEISEAYFDADEFSSRLMSYIDEYKILLAKKDITLKEQARLGELMVKLNTLPRNIRNELFEELDKIEKQV